MGAWAGLFWFLWLAGRTSLYLSSRTAWLVPLGAVLASARAPRAARHRRGCGDTEPLGSRETWMLGMIVLPVVLLLTLPPDHARLLRREPTVELHGHRIERPHRERTRSTSSTSRLREPSSDAETALGRERASASRSRAS